MNREDISRRLPVWHALSELFLDTERQADDYARIAETLRKSGYSPEKLKHILEDEVAPAFIFNLVDIAGEWTPWSEDQVREIIVRSTGETPPMRWLKKRMYRRFLEKEWERLERWLGE